MVIFVIKRNNKMISYFKLDLINLFCKTQIFSVPPKPWMIFTLEVPNLFISLLTLVDTNNKNTHQIPDELVSNVEVFRSMKYGMWIHSRMVHIMQFCLHL